MARFQYVNDTIQELFVQTFTITNTRINEIRVLRQSTAPRVPIAGWTAAATSLAFENLVGTVPPAGVFLCGTEKIQYGAITWTSATAGTFTSCKRGWESTTAAIHTMQAPIYFGDAFALSTAAAATFTNALTTIPFSSLDRPGQIPETGVVMIELEWIWYGGVTYTNDAKTAGNLLYCFRGYNGTAPAAHAGDVTPIPFRFEHIFKHRENVALYNYASSTAATPMYYGFNPTLGFDGTNGLPILFGESVTIPLSPRVRLFVCNGVASGPVALAEWR
jgi:hypothetical protein